MALFWIMHSLATMGTIMIFAMGLVSLSQRWMGN